MKQELDLASNIIKELYSRTGYRSSSFKCTIGKGTHLIETSRSFLIQHQLIQKDVIDERIRIDYTLTQLGLDVAINYNCDVEKYITHLKKREKDEESKIINERKVAEWQVKTKWLPYILSFLALIISIIALFTKK